MRSPSTLNHTSIITISLEYLISCCMCFYGGFLLNRAMFFRRFSCQFFSDSSVISFIWLKTHRSSAVGSMDFTFTKPFSYVCFAFLLCTVTVLLWHLRKKPLSFQMNFFFSFIMEKILSFATWQTVFGR